MAIPAELTNSFDPELPFEVRLKPDRVVPLAVPAVTSNVPPFATSVSNAEPPAMLSTPPTATFWPDTVATLIVPPELTTSTPPPETVGSTLLPPDSTTSKLPDVIVAPLTVWPDETVVVVILPS
jgi:hypothetical protein